MNTEILLAALQEAFQQQEASALETLAKAAVQEHPQQALAYYCLAEANWIKGKQNNAEVCLAKAIELDAQNADYLLRLANFKEARAAWEDARLLYSKVLSLNAQQPQALAGLARHCIEEAADYLVGLELISQAIELDAQRASYYVLRAKAYQELSRFEEALEDANAALALAVEEQALILKINALVELEEQEAVQATYEQLIAIVDNKLEYRISFGNYLLGEGFYAAAEIQFRLSLDMDSANEPVKGLLGLSLLYQAKHQAALEVFDAMAQEAPDDEEIYIQRAFAKAGLQDKKGAIADLKKATEMVSGENKLPLYYREAMLLLELEEWVSAKAIFQQLAASELYQAEGYYGLGLTLQAMGDRAAAFQALQQAQKYRHPEASHQLRTYFAAELQDFQQNMLIKYSEEIAKNAQSTLLSPCFGQFYRFDPYKNKLASNLPADIQKALLAEISDTSLFLSPNGLLLFNPIEKRALQAIYRIEEEDETEALLEIIPLDGSKPFMAILNASETGIEFEPQLPKSQNIFLQRVDLSKCSAANKKLVQQYVQAADLTFLGAAAQLFSQTVFGA